MAFLIVKPQLKIRTTVPKAAQTIEGSFWREYKGPRIIAEYAVAGNCSRQQWYRENQDTRTMKARAVALRPPAISKTTPRSQVVNETGGHDKPWIVVI